MKESRVSFYKRWGEHSRPYFRWQVRLISKYVGNRVADVGCGLGNFAEIYKDKEIYMGFDQDESVREELSKRDKPGNFRLAVSGDICMKESVEELVEARIDTVLCINTLEHIQDDKAAMTNLVNGVQKGGHVCVIVPALPCLYGTLDEYDGHYRRYSKKELVKLTDDLGVSIELLHYMNLIGSIGWFVKGRIAKEKVYSSANFIIIAAIVPITAIIEKWIKPVFGLSMVMVLKKL